MAQLQEYKCPCCGGAVEFNSTLQKMKCPYCDTEFEMSALEELDAALGSKEENMEWNDSSDSQWTEEDTQGLHSYVCKSCGGEIIGDDTLAATECPYCGNPIVMMDQFSGNLKPEFVIPFKLDKAAAKAGLKKHLEGKKLLPKIFKDENHIDEIKGIYVPFWLFDTDVEADISYKGTKVRVWEDKINRYTETSFYGITRNGNMSFANVPADGSSKMDDTLMESIEPFNFADAVDFQTAYLAGYLADKYDVTADDSIPRINERIKATTEEAFRSTVSGYATVETDNSYVRLKNNKAKYCLCPVWLLNTTWNGQKYIFAMNGQTGKFVGDLPVDKGAYRKYFAAIAAGVSAAALAVSYLMYIL